MSTTKLMKPLAPANSARNLLAAAATWPVAQATMSAFGRASSISSGASSDGGGSKPGSMGSMDKPKRKRQRLDHLTQEEKIMRRKLKNRMAAQSARDRKKMKMQDLEGESKDLRKTNEMLTKRNALLMKRVRMLEAENDQLREQLLGADVEPVASTTVEENMLQLMASFQETLEEDADEWSDAEEDAIFENDDVNMSDSLEASEYSPAVDESESLDGHSSDISDDSGLVMSSPVDSTTLVATTPNPTTTKSAPVAGRRVAKSLESAELICEPQQKDQDEAARRKAVAKAAAEAEDAEDAEEVQFSRWQARLAAESKPQVRSTVITSTSSYHSEDSPLDLKITSSSSSSRAMSSSASSRSATSACRRQKLMNFLIPLFSLMMSNPSFSMDVLEESLLVSQAASSQHRLRASSASRKPTPSTSRPSSSSSPASTNQRWNSLLAAAEATQTTSSSRCSARQRARLRPPDH